MVDETVLLVRVQPRASRDGVAGYEQGVLRVRLKAAPVDGRANERLRRFLADRLQIGMGDIEIVSGRTSRTKRVRVTGLSGAELKARLGA